MMRQQRRYLLLYFFIFLTLPFNVNAKLYVITNDVNIREGKGTTYAVLGVVKKGTTVDISEINGAWGKMVYNNKDGYISAKFLQETSENSKSSDKEKNDSHGKSFWTIVIIGGLILLGAISKGASSNGNKGSVRSEGYSNSRVRVNSSIEKNQHWYMCKNCSSKVQKAKMPTSLNCSASTFHQWTDLGEVGDKAYNCKNCGTTVYTNKRPTSLNCPYSTFHNWTEL